MNYSQFTQFSEAKRLLNSNTLTPLVEVIPISMAIGRILAEDIQCIKDHPATDISAMDGYALQASITSDATEGNTVSVPVSKVIHTDNYNRIVIEDNSCARIDTGAIIPANVDAVVMVENVQIGTDQITIQKPVTSGTNIIKKSSNIAINEKIYVAGQQLFAQDIAFLFSQQITDVRVYQQFSIGLLITGNELTRDPVAEPDKTIETTSIIVKHMLAEVSSKIIDFGIIKDEYELLRERVNEIIEEVDILIITGGTSRGTHDYTADVLGEIEGSEMIFHFVSIKPGKPFGAWRIATDKIIFLLPGPPVAAFVTYEFLIKDFINHSYNFLPKYLKNQIVEVKMIDEVKSRKYRKDFIRVSVLIEDGKLVARLIKSQSSSNLSSLTLGNGIIEIGEDMLLIERGSKQLVRLIKHVY